ncbi:MAG: preprotein translocase subunit SecE [Pseudomonadota bacterium]
MAKVNPAAFIAQVRAEGAKVIWPTRKETTLTTVMVFLLSTLFTIFFFFVDSILSWLVQAFLSITL